MPLTLEECIPGTKVRIPKGDPQPNNFWGILQQFNYQLPYLFIGEVKKSGWVKVLMVDTITELGANLFKPEDLDLYEPTSYPLPKESFDGNTEDPVNPTHYNSTSITTFQVVKDWDLDFFLGNVVKYIQRHNRKGKPLEDLKKAQTYLTTKIQELEAHV